MEKYEYLSHTADVKFRARGKTWNEMFTHAAEALGEIVRGEITILEQKEKEFTVEGPDLEVLLHNYLEEFIFLLDAEDFLVAKIKKINFDEKNLKMKVTVTGDEAENYKFTNDVKAITFNEMYIREEEGKYECQVVLDV